MKRWFSILCLLLACGLTPVTLNSAETGTWSESAYSVDYTSLKETGTDLYDYLKDSFQSHLSKSPLWIKEDDLRPYASPYLFASEKTPLRVVYISKGFVQLASCIAHAKAIDHVEPGYFASFIQLLSEQSQDPKRLLPDLPKITNPRYWKDDVINEQASYYNQIVAAVVAINLAHHYVGNYERYGTKLHDSVGNPTTMAMLCTPEEWELAMKLGLENSLGCGFGVDGLKTFYDCFAEMKFRPAWVANFIPPRADLKKLRNQADAIEKRFFGLQK